MVNSTEMNNPDEGCGVKGLTRKKRFTTFMAQKVCRCNTKYVTFTKVSLSIGMKYLFLKHFPKYSMYCLLLIFDMYLVWFSEFDTLEFLRDRR